MIFQDKLKQAIHWIAALTAAVTMQAGAVQKNQPDNVNRNAPVTAVKKSMKDYLDYRVQRGTLINGETQQARRERWQTMKKEKGLAATWDAIDKEELEKLEIPHKDEDGYLFETYEPGKSHTFESYYPNGVQRAKMGKHGEEAEGFYPDGSRKFIRTADGIETRYYPGGKKGEEKIEETPHGIYDAYDVLDEQGRRIEHHYAVSDSHKDLGNGCSSLKDIKKVDLYNPDTQKLEATYTLHDWSVKNGRLAQIGIVDLKGNLNLMNFPKAGKIGDKDYYVEDMTTEMIREIYKEEKAEQGKKRIENLKKLSESR